MISLFEIESYIEAVEHDRSLYEEKNFGRRSEVINQLEELLDKTDQPDKLLMLKSRAARLKSELEKIDIRLFQRLRAAIRTAGYTGKDFSKLITEYVDLHSDYTGRQEEPGYDNLDIFLATALYPFRLCRSRRRI